MTVVAACEDLGRPEDDAFAALAQPRTIFAGRLIAVQGQPLPEICRVRTGVVILNRNTVTGDDYALRVVVPGDMFGTEALNVGARWQLTARAVTDVRLEVLQAERIPQLVHTFPQLGSQLARAVGRELEYLFRYRDVLQHRSAPERLYALLCLLGGVEVPPGEDVLVPVPLTHSELGQIGAMNRETVSRTLAHLERHGRIRRMGRRQLWIVSQPRTRPFPERVNRT